MEYIIDFQAFKEPDQQFIIKKLAVLEIGNQELQLYTFKPPFAWDILPIKYKVENKWLENHNIHESWISGEMEYGELKNIFCKLAGATRVYVNGTEKFHWLKNHLKNVHNLGLENLCSILNELRKLITLRCENHRFKRTELHCVICNVNVLYYLHVFF